MTMRKSPSPLGLSTPSSESGAGPFPRHGEGLAGAHADQSAGGGGGLSQGEAVAVGLGAPALAAGWRRAGGFEPEELEGLGGLVAPTRGDPQEKKKWLGEKCPDRFACCPSY